MKIVCAGTLAFALGACSSSTSSSKTASSTASSTEKSEETAETEVATEGKYEVTNNTGAEIKELYFYKTGSTDKGENYAKNGLANGASVTVDVQVDKKDADGYQMTVEYVGEDGKSVTAFTTLKLEETPLYLKPAADIESGATPFSKPAQ